MKTMQFYTIQYEILIEYFIPSSYKEYRKRSINIEAESEEAALEKFDAKFMDIIESEDRLLVMHNPSLSYYEPLYKVTLLNCKIA